MLDPCISLWMDQVQNLISRARHRNNRAYRAAEKAALPELVYRLGRVADRLDMAENDLDFAAKALPKE